MKTKQKPIKANKLKEVGSGIINRQSHQTFVVLSNPQMSFQAIDWSQITRIAGKKLRSGAISSFNAIKSTVIPVWLLVKKQVIHFSEPYYNRAVSKFEDWNQLFFTEMDHFTMLDEPADVQDVPPSVVNGNQLSAPTGLADRFSGGWKDSNPITFGGLKKHIFRSYEIAVVWIESTIRKMQGKAYQAVVFEIVNEDQLALIPVSNQRRSRLASASFAVSFKPDSLNFSDLYQRFTETRQYFAIKMKNHLNDIAAIGYRIVRKIFPFRMYPVRNTTRNMFLPLLNKSGFGILANNRGYP